MVQSVVVWKSTKNDYEFSESIEAKNCLQKGSFCFWALVFINDRVIILLWMINLIIFTKLEIFRHQALVLIKNIFKYHDKRQAKKQ
ncbi:MAG: hypothetical protein A2825_02250 [Candidatus Taylorbacteria bacterium RIFCSPHIGHO2_01_FULL_43_120]|nr:MAG: hypothetical protein A2825_02250 [Candidatus Taylorbacteria bacterium RIFCSPHIGHO2_01_FULL_43_120]OHA29376.1 MAG: hypothetical protein A3E92_02450 [Candidatus Taylorbacteria bacterium RIFCSPHIGHO2_12_FULL_42_34]OHA31752.1 MAG: hypothetical protein A3B09_01890 [Candidatus Taylorbacteria bacterium RIFCSPLOWO2_01_FULL_43_83]